MVIVLLEYSVVIVPLWLLSHSVVIVPLEYSVVIVPLE